MNPYQLRAQQRVADIAIYRAERRLPDGPSARMTAATRKSRSARSWAMLGALGMVLV